MDLAQSMAVAPSQRPVQGPAQRQTQALAQRPVKAPAQRQVQAPAELPVKAPAQTVVENPALSCTSICAYRITYWMLLKHLACLIL